MGLSKRERIIVLVTFVVVGALVADTLVVTPGFRRLGELKTERQELAAQVEQARGLLEFQKQVAPKWKTLLFDGPRSDAEAESRVGEALGRWSADARLTLSSIKPDRLAGDKGVKEILFVVAGTGSLDAVAWFLYQMETSELPIKVKHLQLGSTSESGENMSLELRFSTLYLASDGKSSPTRSGATGRQSQSRQQEKNNEEQLL